jgi:glycosyltransferase involved in cell wall biosynthesis
MKNNIGVIIPTYKEPDYLDLCIESLYKNCNNNDNFDVYVIIDGHYKINEKVIEKYKNLHNNNFKYINLKQNEGLSYSTNIGVHYCQSNYLLIVNDDNVFPKDWDKILLDKYKTISETESNFFIVPNQIEPKPSIFKQYNIKSFGTKIKEFNLDEFTEYELSIKSLLKDDYTGWTFPLFMKRTDYLKVGGWDLSYKSPHIVDLDFFTKLQLNKMKSIRIYNCSFYHFGGKATKNTDEMTTINKNEFTTKEQMAFKYFFDKWEFPPIRNNDNSIKII